jgi:hypothetical protein
MATCPPFGAFQTAAGIPAIPTIPTKGRIYALAAIATTLLTIFTIGGYHGSEDQMDKSQAAEIQKVAMLKKQIEQNTANYPEAIRSLSAQVTGNQSTNPAASRLAQQSIDTELRSLRNRLTAGLMRDSLPSRLLTGDSKATREWRELRPRLAALANIGNTDAKRWLEYCDWAANSTGKSTTKRDVRLSLLH